jgi:hypothetical protein
MAGLVLREDRDGLAALKITDRFAARIETAVRNLTPFQMWERGQSRKNSRALRLNRSELADRD